MFESARKNVMSIKRWKKRYWVPALIIIGLILVGFMAYKLILPDMWNFLYVNEAPQKADVIIVLSGDTGRLEYGVELFKEGYAGHIIFSGGAASSMRRDAISMGIADDRILLDRRSNSTFENAKNSMGIMQANQLKTAIVVTSGYHTKRSDIIFTHFLPESDVTICAVPDGANANNWWKDSHTSTAVISEYLKLVYYYLFEK